MEYETFTEDVARTGTLYLITNFLACQIQAALLFVARHAQTYTCCSKCRSKKLSRVKLPFFPYIFWWERGLPSFDLFTPFSYL